MFDIISTFWLICRVHSIFQTKDALQISIRSLASSAPGPRVAQRDHSEEPKSTGIDLFLPESNVLSALTWMPNCAAGQTRAHSAERRSKLQCMTSLSSSVPHAFSPQPRWLFLADPLPIRRAPTG